MSENRRKYNLIILLPLFAGALWGVLGIFVRVLDEAGLDNGTIVFTRVAVVSILLTIWILFTDKSQLRAKPKDVFWFGVLGVEGAILFMYAYNYALIELTMSLAVVLMCTAPVFVLLISAVFFKEKITITKLVCMILAFVGCAMISGIFEGDDPIRWSWFGLMMGLVSAFLNGAYMIISKAVTKKNYSPLTISFYSFWCAALVMIPLTDWPTLIGYITAAPFESSAFLVLQAICSSLVPTMAYLYSLKFIDAGLAAILEAGVEPITALIAGIILYNEIPSLIGLIGMALTIGALTVLSLSGDSTE